MKNKLLFAISSVVYTIWEAKLGVKSFKIGPLYF